MLKRAEGMEECEKRVLCQFWTRLVNEIVVTASFLSAFCEQSVLDEEMTKIVKVLTKLGGVWGREELELENFYKEVQE